MKCAPLSSEVWRAYDTAATRCRAAQPGSLQWHTWRVIHDAAASALARADMLYAGQLEDSEIMLILEVTAAVLRGRVRSELLVAALEAVESVLTSPKPEAER